MGRTFKIVSCVAATAALLHGLCAVAAANEADQDAWVVQASAGMQLPVIDALYRIVDFDRRLLALRAYLRAGDSLPQRWSWSQEQISAYPSTSEGKAAETDLDAVAAAFGSANPGFTLQVNRQPRSLDAQITHWNENDSIGIAAAGFASALEQRFGGGGAPSAAELRKALIEWQPNSVAALAAPGLSAHGQARAFDFQVERGGQVIAAMDAASAHRQWDNAGWTQKLHAAVGLAGNHFVGPLQSPYEPWHYAYVPALAPLR
jgi:hypothetical protein